MMLLFCAVVGILLAASCFGYYALLQREVSLQLDRQLQGAAAPVLRDLISEPNSQDINEFNLIDEYFELIDSSGRILQRSRNLDERMKQLEIDFRSSSKTVCQTIRQHDGVTMRGCSIPFQRTAQTFFLLVSTPTREAEQALSNFSRVTFVLLPVSLLLTAVISAWYVGRSLQPIADLTAHAIQMTKRVSDPQRQGDLLLLPVKNPHDELGRLAATFNELLVHVDSALGQLRQFVSDASHELRTPLAVLQGETELLLSKCDLPANNAKTLALIHDELRKLSRIVESLFTLAMADAGQLRLAAEALYLNEVLEETCGLADQFARSKNITIGRRLQREIPYLGDEASFRELFFIFLDNAIKYSPRGSEIHVEIESQDNLIRVSFRDHGIGISPEHLPHIFERFYRVVENGAGETRSGGLGLAIAQAIVTSQRGTIQCESIIGVGSKFTVGLPGISKIAV
jgi:signal transduction histidine kinase